MQAKGCKPTYDKLLELFATLQSRVAEQDKRIAELEAQLAAASKDPRPEGGALGSPPEGGDKSIHWGVLDVISNPVRLGPIPESPDRGYTGVSFLHQVRPYLHNTLLPKTTGPSSGAHLGVGGEL